MKRRRRCQMKPRTRFMGLPNRWVRRKAAKPSLKIFRAKRTLFVALSPKREKGLIAIAAQWNALPRKPRGADTTQQIYIDAVRDFLKAKGIEQPNVKIESILQADLDGDGEEEVLISATNYFSKDNHVPMRSPAGSYSMVLLRRQVAGKVETQLVEGE